MNGGRVRDVVIQGRQVTGQLTDGRNSSLLPEDPTLVSRMTHKGGAPAKPEDSDVNPLIHYLLSWVPEDVADRVPFLHAAMQSGGGRARASAKAARGC